MIGVYTLPEAVAVVEAWAEEAAHANASAVKARVASAAEADAGRPVWAEALAAEAKAWEASVAEARAAVESWTEAITVISWWDDTPWPEIREAVRLMLPPRQFREWLKRPDVIERMEREPS